MVNVSNMSFDGVILQFGEAFDISARCRSPCIATVVVGAQWLSGRVLDSRPKGRGFEPHRRHCVVVLEQDTSILA